jgi:FHS family L-fucose permease-like MFS transporter
MEHMPDKAARNAPDEQTYPFAFSVLTALFFMWGFLTCLNDILVPHLKNVFDLSYVQASLIQFTFFSAYFLLSIPSGKLIGRFGYQKGIVMGLATSGIGALLFVPAALVPSYPLFLLALFTLAAGITMLQVAANPYVSVLGPSRTASSRLNLSQAFNSLGTTVAPWLGGILILSAATMSADAMQQMSPEQLQAWKLAEAASVKLPYLLLAGALFVLAGVFMFLKLPVIAEMEHDESAHTYGEVMAVPHLKWGVLGIFVYVGGEVSIGSYLVNYMGLEQIAGMAEKEAAGWVSYYWGGAMIGRFVGSALMQKLDAGKLLGAFAAVAVVLSMVGYAATGQIAMMSVLSIGLFNSIMFPTIFTLSIRGLGSMTGKGSSLLIMAIVGGALLPVLMGYMADTIGLQKAFLLPALCYVYIAWFGFSGSRK